MHHYKPPKREYRKDIDGIRALAVLAVLIFHINPAFLPGGYLGVDVFFVISGYLITGIILRENHLKTFSFARFYARRVKRIFPALFVVLILSSCVATFLLTPEMYINYMKSARYASAQLANFFFSRKVDYFSEGFSGQPLLHTWSLGVEEQFYLFWPLLIFLCFILFNKSKAAQLGKQSLNRKIAVVFLLLSLLSYIVCYSLVGVNQNLAFYMFYSRAFEFCIGGFLSLRILPTPVTKAANFLIGTLGFILLCYSFLFIHEEYLGRSFLQFAVIVPCIGTALIIHANWHKGFVNKVLASKLPSYIGKISYSLYLYHWPIIIFWKLFSNTHHIGIVASLGIILLSFILSILSYFLVEQPARKSSLSDKSVLISGVLIIIAFAVLFKNIEDFDLAPWRISRYVPEHVSSPEKYAPGCRQKTKTGVMFFECTDSEDENIPTIALVGDSHAPHFLYSITAWANENDYNVKYIAIPGCPMLLGEVTIQSILSEEDEQMCQNALPSFASEIVDDPKVELVLIAQRFDLFHNGKGFISQTRQITFEESDGSTVKDHISFYNDQLSYTVDTIRKKGKDVVILKQVPIFGNIKACDWEPRLKKFFSKERICDYDTGFIEKWQRPSINFLDEFAASHQVEVFDPAQYFKSPLINDINIYSNIDHLNEHGFRYITPYFKEEMDAIMVRLKKKKDNDGL